jgi:hypothetical protein
MGAKEPPHSFPNLHKEKGKERMNTPNAPP